MNLANLFEGYADTALAAWNDPKSKSADQKSSKFYLQSYPFHLRLVLILHKLCRSNYVYLGQIYVLVINGRDQNSFRTVLCRRIGEIRWGRNSGQIQWFRDMVKVVKKWNILCQRFLVSDFNHSKSRSWINNPEFYHLRQSICSDGTKIEPLYSSMFFKK